MLIVHFAVFKKKCNVYIFFNYVCLLEPCGSIVFGEFHLSSIIKQLLALILNLINCFKLHINCVDEFIRGAIIIMQKIWFILNLVE